MKQYVFWKLVSLSITVAILLAACTPAASTTVATQAPSGADQPAASAQTLRV